MKTKRDQIEAVFGAAIELKSPDQREVYLAKACQNDAQLRAEVNELIQAYDKAGGFLASESDQPADRVGADGQGETWVLPIAEKPGDRVGRYKLLQQIGEGGCGVVYVAEQEEPVRRRVALKVIKLGMDTRNVIARFEAERQALALMDHPNIAKVLDAGATETGRPFFVMELVRGVRITDYCDQKKLPTKERLDLFIQVCHAVQHAHQKGIIHRDIKPSNILVTLHDGVPVPKVIDFGIAKATTQQRLTDKTLYTAFEQFIGTPAYMSPEQAEMSGLDIDTRSDIYSLGVLLYELLTGQTPFDAKVLLAAGLDEMRRILREQEPMRPSTRLATLLQGDLGTTAEHRHVEPPQLVHLLRGDLDWIVMKALEKERTRRYESAAGLAGDLQRHLNHEMVTARPPSTAYRVQKFVRRNKLMVSATASVAVALVLGLVFSLWQWRRAEKALGGEARQREAAQAEWHRAEEALATAQSKEWEARLNAYASDMNLAIQALRENRRSAVRALLDRHLPRPGESDLRGWEWNYLNREAQSDEAWSLEDSEHEVYRALFSPDGRWLAAATAEPKLIVWDFDTRQPEERLGHEAFFQDVTFSRDGRLLLTASDEQSGTNYLIRCWQVGDWKRPVATLTNKARIDSIALSLDGHYLAVTELQGSVSVHGLGAGARIIELGGRSPDHHPPLRAVFSPVAPVLAVGETNCINLWTLNPATKIRTIPHESYSQVGGNLAFSPDGASLAVGGRSLSVFRLDREEAPRVLAAGPLEARRIAFSPSGALLAVAYTDSTLTLFDTQDWKPVRSFAGPGSTPSDLAFSPDNRQLVATFKDNLIRVWNTDSTPRRRITTLVPPGKPREVYSLGGAALFLTGSNQFQIVAGIPPNIQVSGQLPATFAPDPPDAYPFGLSVSPSGRWIAYRDQDGTHRVMDPKTGAFRCQLGGHGVWLSLYRAFSPDDSMLTGGDGQDHTRIVWSAETGQEIVRRDFEGIPRWNQPWWLSDSRTIMLSVPQGAYVWDVQDNTTWLLAPEGGSTIIGGVLSQDGTKLATFDRQGRLRIWDPRRREQIHALDSTEASTLEGYTLIPFAFSADGRRLAMVAGSPALKIYDTANWRELGSINLGVRPVTCRFSSDGHWLSIGAEDVEDGRRGAIYLDGSPL